MRCYRKLHEHLVFVDHFKNEEVGKLIRYATGFHTDLQIETQVGGHISCSSGMTKDLQDTTEETRGRGKQKKR